MFVNLPAPGEKKFKEYATLGPVLRYLVAYDEDADPCAAASVAAPGSAKPTAPSSSTWCETRPRPKGSSSPTGRPLRTRPRFWPKQSSVVSSRSRRSRAVVQPEDATVLSS